MLFRSVVFDGRVQTFVAAVLLVSAGYALLRKHLASLVERLVPRVPPRVRSRLPERFRDAGDPAPRAEAGD